ncbi:CRISPR-associated protein Cas4 [Aureibacter tunicatorum]|uniref:CRISPR-associated exonuclease Cas4 n=1 Tax=Aureibacter tunicatorum TaxID=866807 RepID=A0AAE4BVC6_9BACT|nr:CRISPR-associated protein Cas4 [Aureibacter tunicatorum]MDR6241945.1 CRISPR-associated exonuclease Cas4 [Aureibacter tunicatorum]BDD07498.1 CRISPR-associated protein Cas4 [Aureibacter tunicatorum]
MIQITALHVHYLHICHRKLWLFSNGIGMEHTSDAVADGTLLHDTAYAHRTKRYVELDIPGGKIDYYDPANKVIHETKRSGKMEQAQQAQIKFYLYQLHELGIVASASLDYPEERKSDKIIWLDSDHKLVDSWISQVHQIAIAEISPPKREQRFCQSCAYYDFCWSVDLTS